MFIEKVQSALVSRCKFVKNQINDGNGGAISVNVADRVVILDSQFSSNVAKTVDGTRGTGGAINLLDVRIQARVERCTFDRNNADRVGGAVAASRVCFFSVADSLFTHNDAGISGGAISASVLSYYDCENS